MSGKVNGISTILPGTCEITVPEPDAELHSVISRWSDAGVSLPAAVIVPSTEDDILAVIQFAAQHGLQIIPGNGGHGSFVPINNHTLYLDMKKFKDVNINEEEKSVSIGGGAVAGDVLKACSARGFYTLCPNSNAVGMVGAFLGGGSGAFGGIHGFAVDHVLSVRILTVAGKILTLTHSSTGEEGRLFHALRGGGLGVGVVTSLKLRAFPVSDLNLTGNKIWQRKLVFAPNALSFAAEAFVSMLPPPGPLVPLLAFAKTPASSPAKGSAVIMLIVSYYSPAIDAEKAAAAILRPEVAEKAISTETAMLPIQSMNDGAEPFNTHGGLKEYYTCMLEQVSVKSILGAYERWQQYWDELGDQSAGSFNVMGSWSTKALEKNAGNHSFYQWRKRGVFMQTTPLYRQKSDHDKAKALGEDVVARFRETDNSRQLPKAGFASNMRFGQDLAEIWTEEMLRELNAVKQIWDGRNIFWSPLRGW